MRRARTSFAVLGIGAALVLPGAAVAAFTVPNTFQTGEVISSSKMNQNFSEVATELQSLRTQLDALKLATATTVVVPGSGHPWAWGTTKRAPQENDFLISDGTVCADTAAKDLLWSTPIPLNTTDVVYTGYHTRDALSGIAQGQLVAISANGNANAATTFDSSGTASQMAEFGSVYVPANGTLLVNHQLRRSGTSTQKACVYTIKVTHL